MRLSAQTKALIHDLVAEIWGPQATVRVFGSRLDDHARGGDIDLLVELPQPIADRERKILQLIARLQMQLGDQPIDVLVLDPDSHRAPIHEHAMKTGVRL